MIDRSSLLVGVMLITLSVPAGAGTYCTGEVRTPVDVECLRELNREAVSLSTYWRQGGSWCDGNLGCLQARNCDQVSRDTPPSQRPPTAQEQRHRMLECLRTTPSYQGNYHKNPPYAGSSFLG